MNDSSVNTGVDSPLSMKESLLLFGAFSGRFSVCLYNGKLRKTTKTKTEPVLLQFVGDGKRILVNCSKEYKTLYIHINTFTKNKDCLLRSPLVRVSLPTNKDSECNNSQKDPRIQQKEPREDIIEQPEITEPITYCISCGKEIKGKEGPSKCKTCRLKAIQDEDINSIFYRNISPKRTGREMIFRYYGPAGD